MFYLLKENTINETEKTFVTGGLGIDYRDPSITSRYITHKKEKALVFESIDEAKKYLCKGYVVAIHVGGNNFKAVA